MLISIPAYITGDTHFFHRNMMKHCLRPADFDEQLVRNWNEVVTDPRSSILHVGDLVHWHDESWRQFERIAPKLNGVKYLILGNHDKTKVSLYEDLGFTVIKPYTILYGKQDHIIHFDHYPKNPLPEGEWSIHGHTHGNNFPGQTPRHLDVGVDCWWGRPVPTAYVIDQLIQRVDYYGKGGQ